MRSILFRRVGRARGARPVVALGLLTMLAAVAVAAVAPPSTAPSDVPSGAFTLRELDLDVPIRTTPTEVERAIPFEDDDEHASYDPDAAHLFWRQLVQARAAPR